MKASNHNLILINPPEVKQPVTNSVWASKCIAQLVEKGNTSDTLHHVGTTGISYKTVYIDKSGWTSNTVEMPTQEPNNYSVWTVVQPTETTKVAQSDIVAGFTFLKDIVDYAENYGLYDYLQFAIESIKSIYGQDVKMIVNIENDPEINEDWINVVIQTDGEVRAIVDKFDHFIELWVQHVRWPQRRMIRFSFSPS